MRGILLLFSVFLAGCAGLAEQAAYSISGTGAAEPGTFGVSALVGDAIPANFAAFNRRGEEAAEFRAQSICTLGHSVVDQRIAPFDPGQLLVRTVRCEPYILSF